MRIIDLHCYPNTKEWIACQQPYVDALAKYWKRQWRARPEEEVVEEFTTAGVEALLVALDLERQPGRRLAPTILCRGCKSVIRTASSSAGRQSIR